MNVYSYLGASSDASAWEAYLSALRDQMKVSWAGAESAYLGLKQVREQLGLPFIDDSPNVGEGGSAASHGAWTTDLDTQAQDLHAMSTLAINALDDAIAGKRKLVYAEGALSIEALPTDLVLLAANEQGVPALIGGPASSNPGQPQHVSAPIGVGVPALVWVATATTSVLALPIYFVVDAAVNGLRDVAEQKTMKTVAEKSYDCVQSGKCTPEQAVAINNGIFGGAAAVRKAHAEEEQAKKPTDWTKVVTTVMWGALGLGVLYAILKYVPAPQGGVKMLPAPAHENPRKLTAAPDKHGRHPRYKHLVMFEVEPHYGSYILTAVGHSGDALISEDDAHHMFGSSLDDGFAYLTDEYLQLLEKAA